MRSYLSLCYIFFVVVVYDSLFSFNTLKPWQNGRRFADDMFKCIFLNENVWIPIEMSLTFVPKGPINNIPALIQIMAWRRPGDKPLSEAMMVNLPTHICVSRPQWVKSNQRCIPLIGTIIGHAHLLMGSVRWNKCGKKKTATAKITHVS